MAQPPAATPCVMCLAPATKMCSGCRSHWYCTRECQRKHWISHKDDCGKSTQQPKRDTTEKLREEIAERERQFHAVTEIIRQHREKSDNKNVWLTRYGDAMAEDLEDAKALPGIKDQLDSFDGAPTKQHEASMNILFSAAEGVGRAKSLAYFEKMKAGQEGQSETAQ
eukprot:TRINITY_DN15808_c0_g1_i1.p1 TRINITY_DN15808_c0_g1~~TRINITY_DN15808_c0_g1_i1.p1  ORF type:complete len:180 (+),score=30.53 TRINITY_DN15808_c0_g1_i1:40-540(+)